MQLIADFNEQILTEARRRFDSQARRLEELRGRPVSLLGSAAVVVGLIGVRTSATPHRVHSWLVAGTLISFAVVVALAVVINRPGLWNDGEKVDVWLKRRIDGHPAVDDFEYNLALRLDQARSDNADAVQKRVRVFKWLCLALGAQVAFGAVAVLR